MVGIAKGLPSDEGYIPDWVPYPGEHIFGWMEPESLGWLYHKAREMDSIIEIGCWLGRSTYALCSGCRGTVHTIDTFKGSREHKHYIRDGLDVRKEFNHNMAEFDNLVIHPTSSYRASSRRSIPDSVDMVFIDGNHYYPVVYMDLVLYGFRARKLLCGHNAQHPGVSMALRAYTGGNPTGVVTSAPGGIWQIDMRGYA